MEIDLSKLARNYQEQPLKPHEQICKEDLQYLYLECNLTYEQIAPIYNRKGVAIANRCKKLDLIKSKEQHKLSVENMYMEKYGVKNPAQLQSSKEKAKKTMLEKYGVDNVAKLESITEKKKKTSLKKYGVDNVAKAQEIKDKTKQNNLSKYNVEHPMMLQEIKEKQQKTLLEKYGVNVPLKNNKIKEKQANTCLERYGTKNPMSSLELRNKHKKNIREKYGVDNVAQLVETKRKMYQTMKQNGSFGKSKEEDFIFNCLIQIFPLTERQHSTAFYPYPCDFYIPELDLWIEYQKFEGHGKHPFDPNNEEDIRKIEFWKEKSKEVNFKNKPKHKYLSFIDTWTRKDPHKRRIAEEYKLNWIEFFDIKEFIEWYKNICDNLF